MKILFNRRPVAGPWGGGSKVLSAIVEECRQKNHDVFFEEEVHTCFDLDIIFCMDPRPTVLTNFQQLIDKKISQKCKIVQRVGDLGTHGKPELFDLQCAASKFSDVLVFPSNWAKDTLAMVNNKTSYVIPNAPLQQFCIENQKKNFSKLKIVSHHWSTNALKGFDVYKKLDEYCKETGNAEFTFIGRKPDDVSLKNYIPPLDVEGLVNELPKYNVYVTASKQEAGANHVLEAMAIGLPVIYHEDGGSINEYCSQYGLSYKGLDDLIQIIESKKDVLQNLSNDMCYKRNSRDMAKEYVSLFESLI